MSADQAVNYLSSVGFPIVACYFMWKFINTTLADFSKSLNEVTLALKELCVKMGGENDERSTDAD